MGRQGVWVTFQTKEMGHIFYIITSDTLWVILILNANQAVGGDGATTAKSQRLTLFNSTRPQMFLNDSLGPLQMSLFSCGVATALAPG